MEIDLVRAIRGELLKQGVTVIPANLDIPLFLDIDGDSVKPAILPNDTQYGLNPEYHAIWCKSADDGHITPCEGEWDIAAISGVDGNRDLRDITGNLDICLIRSVTVAEGADGEVYVEIAWNPFKYAEYGTNRPDGDETDTVTRNALTYAIARVLATIRHNRAQHRMYA